MNTSQKNTSESDTALEPIGCLAAREPLFRAIERLDAFVILFSRHYGPLIDNYICATDDERLTMKNPLPYKKTRLMFRATKTLIKIRAMQLNDPMSWPLVIYSLVGVAPPNSYFEGVGLASPALREVRADVKAVRKPHQKSFRKTRKSRVGTRSRNDSLNHFLTRLRSESVEVRSPKDEENEALL